MIPRTSTSTIASPVRRAGLAMLLAFASSACYAYQPIIRDDLAPGDPVRLRLSATAAEEVTNRMGGLAVRSVEGPLLRATSDSLSVEASWGAYFVGTVFEGRRDTLRFHRSQVLEVDRRQFSRMRTGLVVGALVAAGVVVVRSVGGGGSPSSDPGPSHPTHLRIPIPIPR